MRDIPVLSLLFLIVLLLLLLLPRPGAAEPVPMPRPSLPAASRPASSQPSAPGGEAGHALGLEVQGLDGEGVLVRLVRPGTSAAAAGLAAGDMVMMVGSRRVLDEVAFAHALSLAPRRAPVELTVLRGGQMLSAVVRLEQPPPAAASAAAAPGIAAAPELLRRVRACRRAFLLGGAE